MTMTFGGLLMTFWSAEAAQSVPEALAAAQPLLASLMRQIPPPPVPALEPFAQQTIALDWTRRATYAVVAGSASNIAPSVKTWIPVGMGAAQQAHGALVTGLVKNLKRARPDVNVDPADHAAPVAGEFLTGTRDDYRPP